MGEYHDVAQFIMEQGGLSITGIQEIAACKVQASSHCHLTMVNRSVPHYMYNTLYLSFSLRGEGTEFAKPSWRGRS